MLSIEIEVNDQGQVSVGISPPAEEAQQADQMADKGYMHPVASVDEALAMVQQLLAQAQQPQQQAQRPQGSPSFNGGADPAQGNAMMSIR